MKVTKYYIPGFSAMRFLLQVNRAMVPLVSPYSKLSLAQRASLCLQVSSVVDTMLGVEPEDRMDVIRFQNGRLAEHTAREFIRRHHPAGVKDAFCIACGQDLPESSP